MVGMILIASIAIFALYIARVVRQYYALRRFGGHWSAGWSRLWLLRTQGSGEMHKHFTAINKKHGECSSPFSQQPPVGIPRQSFSAGFMTAARIDSPIELHQPV